jgi:hypothetical protein
LLLGHTPVAAVEIDKHCQKVLRQRQLDGMLPEFPIFDDVRTFDGRAFVDSLASECYRSAMSGTPKKMSQSQLLDAKKLYEDGASCADVAAAYGVTRQALWARLSKICLMRPTYRYGKENHFYRGGAKADGWVHNVTERAIRCGVLTRQPCEVCASQGEMSDGRSDVQAHHDDYNKPLEVRWLCQRHHHEWHIHNSPVRRTEAPSVDIVAGGFP